MFFSISPPLGEENRSNIWRVPPRWGGDLVKFLVSDSPRGRRSSQIPVKCLPYGEEIISFFNTSPPRRGGSQALFRHFSSPQGRQSRPFSTLLLPAGEAVKPFFDISPPRRVPAVEGTTSQCVDTKKYTKRWKNPKGGHRKITQIKTGRNA